MAFSMVCIIGVILVTGSSPGMILQVVVGSTYTIHGSSGYWDTGGCWLVV